MSRKVDIRTKMAELQREYSELNGELKELVSAEERGSKLERFKDYKFKVGAVGYSLYEEDKIEDLTDDDKALAEVGQKTGIPFIDAQSNQGFFYAMLKDREEHKRVKLLFARLEAFDRLTGGDKYKERLDAKVRDELIKVILGEE